MAPTGRTFRTHPSGKLPETLIHSLHIFTYLLNDAVCFVVASNGKAILTNDGLEKLWKVAVLTGCEVLSCCLEFIWRVRGRQCKPLRIARLPDAARSGNLVTSLLLLAIVQNWPESSRTLEPCVVLCSHSGAVEYSVSWNVTPCRLINIHGRFVRSPGSSSS